MEKQGARPERADGRFPTLGGWLHHRLKQLQPTLAFDPAFTPASFRAWQRVVRRRLGLVLGLPRPASRQPAPKLIDDQPRAGYRLQRWELYPEPDRVAPMLMLVPDGVTARQRAGAVLCLPGSDHPLERLAGEPEPPGSPPNTFPDHNAMGLHVVRHGLIALCLENPGTGSTADPRYGDWRRHSWELAWMGRCYEGLSVFQARAAFHWLRRHPAVDPRRIAACGHSLGGKTALLLGVLEPSLLAVVWNSVAYAYRACLAATCLKPLAPWQYVPGFINWFDYPDLMAALAPRALLLSEGGRGAELRKIRQAYSLAGAGGRLKISYVPRYRPAARRTHDRKPIPDGISREAYMRYLNTDNAEHRFQCDVAVPWLSRTLAPPVGSGE